MTARAAKAARDPSMAARVRCTIWKIQKDKQTHLYWRRYLMLRCLNINNQRLQQAKHPSTHPDFNLCQMFSIYIDENRKVATVRRCFLSILSLFLHIYFTLCFFMYVVLNLVLENHLFSVSPVYYLYFFVSNPVVTYCISNFEGLFSKNMLKEPNYSQGIFDLHSLWQVPSKKVLLGLVFH